MWEKSYGRSPWVCGLDLSFEDRFGNVAVAHQQPFAGRTARPPAPLSAPPPPSLPPPAPRHACNPHREVYQELDARRRMVLELDRTLVVDQAPTPRCCSHGHIRRHSVLRACGRGRAGRQCTSAAAGSAGRMVKPSAPRSMLLAFKLERHRWKGRWLFVEPTIVDAGHALVWRDSSSCS